MHAAVVQRRSRVVAHTNALGVPATPAPVTCCGGTIAGSTPPAASATSSPHPVVDSAAMLTAVARQSGAPWPQAFATPALLKAYHVVALDQAAILTARGRVVYDGGLPSNGQLR